MKPIMSHVYAALALLLGAFALLPQAQAVVAAPDGVSLDDSPGLALQNDVDSTSPELAGVETQTVLGLYNPSTRETRIWYMDNNVHVGTVAGPRVPAGNWSPVSAADFNGDGHIDVLFFNPTTGRTWIGYLFAGTLTGAFGPTLPSGWQLVATAHFNHDGHPDFLLLNSSTGQTSIWYMNNNIHIGTTLLRARVYESLLAVADFNGDRYPDWLLNVSDDPPLYSIFDMHNNVYKGVGDGRGRYFPFVGATDFNRDGTADILLYYSSRRQTAIWYMNDNVPVASAGGPFIPSGYNLFAP